MHQKWQQHMYGYWDMEQKGHNFFVILNHFSPVYRSPPTPLEVPSFTHVYQKSWYITWSLTSGAGRTERQMDKQMDGQKSDTQRWPPHLKNWHILHINNHLKDTLYQKTIMTCCWNINLKDIIRSATIANNHLLCKSLKQLQESSHQPFLTRTSNICFKQLLTTKTFKSIVTNWSYKIYIIPPLKAPT